MRTRAQREPALDTQPYSPDGIINTGPLVSAMEPRIDSALVAAFGSATRVRVLAVLANAASPLTAYRVALVGGIPVDKAYREVRRLARAGLVERQRNGWVLVDDDLRSMLRRRVRVRWDQDWDRERRGWAEETPNLLSVGLATIRGRLLSDPAYLRPRGWKPTSAARRTIRELNRPPEKDAMLRRTGLRSSSREDWAYEH